MEKSNILFEGVYSATFSVYDKEMNVIKPSIEKLISYNLKNGIKGFYVGGNTGECTVLPNKTRMQMLEAVKENAGDAEKVYRSSGYTYITAIPYYMADTAGYALDWMNSKIKDTETDDNFRQIVLGEKDVHWTTTSDGGYMPINPAFAEKDSASYYMTGSNENKYTAYWLARVRKQPELFRAWSELMEDADEVGVYNVADFTPPLGDYNKYRSSVEEYAQNQFYVMLKEGTGSLNNVLAQLNGNQGCSKATVDINNWYQNVYTK